MLVAGTKQSRRERERRSGNLGKKVTSMTGIEQRVERSEGGVIKVREKRDHEGGDETSLSVSFPQL
jgi:hypothetical protein